MYRVSIKWNNGPGPQYTETLPTLREARARAKGLMGVHLPLTDAASCIIQPLDRDGARDWSRKSERWVPSSKFLWRKGEPT